MECKKRNKIFFKICVTCAQWASGSVSRFHITGPGFYPWAGQGRLSRSSLQFPSFLSGMTAQGGHWPSQEAFSRPAFFLQVFSNAYFLKLGDLFLGHQSI
ncbi:hypothetical protein TNCV_1500281 [Trichonephila clavipes]|nr:hypothetical protein TNCV_1500281 [Trichonephila clavipes]